ncbi:MAG: hypothetical protein K6F34_06595 [Lachnospiraceae bacterium]|nr:hypothetical protein [Lachnospiraceae bacterium]
MEKDLGLNNIKKIWLAGIYYIPAVLLYVVNMFIPALRPGVIATVFMLCVAAELVIRRQLGFTAFIDRLVAAYFIYNALSVIWLLRSGMPFSVYAGEFVVSLLPVIFYYSGRSSRSQAFYMNFLIAVLITGILGIILQTAMPQFYIDYSYKIGFASKADAATCRVRMDSVVGSTVLGFLSVAGMLVSIPLIMSSNTEYTGTFPKASVFKSSGPLRLFGIASMFINMIVVFMCNQRSAMVVAILVIVYLNFLLFKAYDDRMRKRRAFLIEIAALAAGFILFSVIKQDAALKAYYRLVSLPGAIGQRSEQWVAAVNNMYSTWLGNGLGANGHRAIGIEDAFVVADGGIIKTYCEQGVFGFSMFIYILILTFKKGSRDIMKYCAEVGIIAAALLQSIGSNILSFQLSVPVFWFAIGRIHSQDMEEES